ncbi:hypothetical protein AC1031_001318 [Aphanomyces cochlioides]|nr:hypothetical protein AC1031_001318 [Aphanomyces cochlioides]
MHASACYPIATVGGVRARSLGHGSRFDEDAMQVQATSCPAAQDVCGELTFYNFLSKTLMTQKKRNTNVPKFLRHLYSILTVEDPSIISWSADGMSIQLFSVQRLENEILPKYFKHNKLASFQRQLNYFGFRKWTKTQSCVCTFSHTHLHRHSTPDDMQTVSRKQHALDEPSSDVSVWSNDTISIDDILALDEPVDLKLQDWDITSFEDSFDWFKADTFDVSTLSFEVFV